MILTDLPFDSFATIPITTGTLQNINEKATIEVATSETMDSGLILYPHEKFEWVDSTIYVRSAWDGGEVTSLAVLPLLKGGAGGGGGGGSTVTVTERNITIPATGWTDSGNTDYPYTVTISATGVTAAMIPDIVFSVDELEALADCGLSTACETVANGVVIYAKNVPASAISAKLRLTTM